MSNVIQFPIENCSASSSVVERIRKAQLTQELTSNFDLFWHDFTYMLLEIKKDEYNLYDEVEVFDKIELKQIEYVKKCVEGLIQYSFDINNEYSKEGINNLKEQK